MVSGTCVSVLPRIARDPGIERCLGFFYKNLLPVQRIALAVITALVFCASSLILRPFITSISWAVALAVLVYPAYQKLRLFRIYPSVAASVVTTLVGLTVVVPAIWVAHSLFSAAVVGLDTILPASITDMWETLLRDNPSAAKSLQTLRRVFQIPDTLNHALQSLGSHADLLLRGSIVALLESALTLFIVFFLLRDGEVFLVRITQLVPLSPTDTTALVERIHDTIHATLFGMVAVAALQGFLGALLLWWLELPGVVVWGTIMALLALVPYLGSFIVWVPVAIFLAMQGDWYRSLVTVTWGTIVIGLSDNLAYPVLVGKRLHYHSLLVFFFLVGGVVLFGTAGVVLGPIMLATTDRLLWIWGKEQHGGRV
jgi:predicted PurR-regulated permease PerM